MGLLVGSEALFIPSAFLRLSNLYKVSTTIIIFFPYFFTYKSVTTKSSLITRENHWYAMRQYPYDHVLFQPGHACSTCQFFKPARSKHCSLCKGCIARHDHHCIWIMNCVGRDNHPYFVALLASLAFLVTYGTYLAYVLLTNSLQANSSGQSHETMPRVHWSKGLNWPQYFQSWGWVIAEDHWVGVVGLLALFTSPLAWGFFIYHAYLIWAGMTTNESSKWSDMKEDIADGFFFKAEPSQARERDFEIEPMVSWPVTSDQCLLRSEQGLSSAALAADDQGGLGNSDGSLEESDKPGTTWRRVHGIHEIDNIYDLGFWDNLQETMSIGA